MMYFVDRRDHASPLFLDANILLLTFLNYQSISNTMHDINNNNAPSNILNFFEKTSSIHSYYLCAKNERNRFFNFCREIQILLDFYWKSLLSSENMKEK